LLQVLAIGPLVANQLGAQAQLWRQLDLVKQILTAAVDELNGALVATRRPLSWAMTWEG
jgi:hypothetical protein